MNDMSDCERHSHRRAATKTNKARVTCGCGQVYWTPPDEALTTPCPWKLWYRCFRGDGCVTYPEQYEG